MNNYKTMALCALAALIAGCGATVKDAKEGTAQPGSSVAAQTQSLVFSFPTDNQTEVPGAAVAVLQFSSGVDAEDAANISWEYDNDGSPVAVDFTATKAGDTSLMLTPTSPLQPSTDYRLSLSGVTLEKGVAADQVIEFSTQGDPDAKTPANASFEISRLIPDGTNLEVIEFSSFRFQFSQPLDTSTVTYGTNVQLLDASQQLVPADIVVRDFYLTVDPQQDLTPGASYTLSVTGVQSIYGESVSDSFSVVPVSAGVQGELVLEIMDSNPSDTGIPTTSELTGMPINVVPLKSVLLGLNGENQTQLGDTGSDASPSLVADLAEVPPFDARGAAIPLRLPKGSRLTGSAIDLLVGGQIPLGINSGDITIELIADGMGYLKPNPYSNIAEAFRQVELYMDVAIVAGNSAASGAVTQNILHVQLVGVTNISVEQSSLLLSAVSVVELNILGLEKGSSILSLVSGSYPDQNNAPLPSEDIDPPELQVWVPGTEQDYKHRPADPIIITYDEPIRLQGDSPLTFQTTMGQAVPFSYEVDGASLVIRPSSPLAYNTSYQVTVSENAVMDITGNAATDEETFDFDMPVVDTSEEAQYAPVILATYPGFPCTPNAIDLANGSVGRCVGSGEVPVERYGGRRDPNLEARDSDGEAGLQIPADDLMPLTTLPANRSIQVMFSQDMDADSINETTVLVQEVDATGTVTANVAGELSYSNRQLTFSPNAPWSEGRFYKYTLVSAVSDADCGTDSICDSRGLPLHTQNLAAIDARLYGPTEGGPDLEVYFKGGAAVSSVLTPLLSLPTADVNGNFQADENEPKPSGALANFSLDLLDAEGMTFSNSVKLSRDPEADVYTVGFNAGRLDDTAVVQYLESGSAVPTPAPMVLFDVNVGCGFVPNTEATTPPELPIADCKDGAYSFTSAALFSEVVGFVEPSDSRITELEDIADLPQDIRDNGAVLTYINPAQIFATSSELSLSGRASTTLISFGSAATGPLVMRIRYSCDPSDTEAGCVAADSNSKGWIYEDSDGSAAFWAQLNLYVDTPGLTPEAFLQEKQVKVLHHVRSFPISLTLKGKLSLLPDGRLVAQVSNENAVKVVAEIEAYSCFVEQGFPQSCPEDYKSGTQSYFPTVYLQILPGDVSLNIVTTPVK